MILASNSQRRQEILKDAGFNFRVITSNIEETSDKKIITEKILDIAEKKLEQIAKNNVNEFILAADTVVELDKNIFGKPKDREEAFKFLKLLSGKIHRVITAYVFKNISKNIDKEVNVSLFNKKEEKNLYEITSKLKGNIEDINILLEHKDIINNFFENVIINDSDENIRNNRLALVDKIVNKLDEVIEVK